MALCRIKAINAQIRSEEQDMNSKQKNRKKQIFSLISMRLIQANLAVTQ